MRYPASIAAAVREYVEIPSHVATCAGMCAYDLMHGPSFAKVPPAGIEAIDPDCQATYAADLEDVEGEITEVYSGPVGEALRAFLADLPSALYVDEDCGGVSEREPEPEGYWIDSEGEMHDSLDEEEAEALGATWHEYDMSGFWQIDRSGIVLILFGETIARHFN